MRISFISPTVNLSGGIKVMVIYARALKQMGHTVCVVSPPPREIPFRQRLNSWLRGNGWSSPTLSPQSHLDGSGIDHIVLDRWRPVTDDDVPDADIVIATWWETAEWVSALRASKGAKVYFIQHHELFSNLPIARCRATYRLPLHKIVIAQWLKDVMINEYGDLAVDLVPNSVDRDQFFAPVRGKQPRPTVGFLYSSFYIKGADVTLAALRSVRACKPDLRIISFGSERPTAEFQLPEGAEFYFCPRQDRIRDLYAQCDVWITASRSEGFNLPALEAMACRTPVVATRTGWPEEAVKTGLNGILVDVGDVVQTAQGVEWILSRSDEEWRKLSANAHETAAQGSWEESAKLFEKALQHACQRSRRGEISGNCFSTEREPSSQNAEQHSDGRRSGSH